MSISAPKSRNIEPEALVGKDLRDSPSPAYDQTPPHQLDHGTECRIHSILKHLQGGRLHHLPGQEGPSGQKKKTG